MKRNIIFILISSLYVVSISLALAASPAEWRKIIEANEAPEAFGGGSLMKDVEVKVTDDRIKAKSEEKMPMDSENITNRKNLLNKGSNSENQTDFIMKILAESKLTLNQQGNNNSKASTHKGAKNGPLNTILLLINKLDEHDQILQTNFKTLQTFSFQGHMQNCPKQTLALEFPGKYEDCDCKTLFRSNIVSLLSWAEHVKNMSSAAYDISDINSQAAEMEFQKHMNSRVQHKDQEIANIWLDVRSVQSDTFEDKSHEENLWDMKDALKKVKKASLQDLPALLRIYDNYMIMKKFEDQRASALLESMSRIFENLPSSRNNKNGYLLVITLDADEFHDTLKLLNYFVQSPNTLTIVTSACARDKDSMVPVFARGPALRHLVHMGNRVLYELPSLVRTIIDNDDCHGTTNNCGEPRFPSNFPPGISDPGVLDWTGGRIIPGDDVEGPRNRFVRSDEQLDDQVQEKSISSDETPKANVSKSEKVEEEASIAINTTEKNSVIVNIKEMSLDVDIATKMGDDPASNNCHPLTSYSNLIIAEILTITTIYSLKF